MTTGHAQDAEQPETGITPGDKGAFRDVLSKDHARRGKPPVHLVDMTPDERIARAKDRGIAEVPCQAAGEPLLRPAGDRVRGVHRPACRHTRRYRRGVLPASDRRGDPSGGRSGHHHQDAVASFSMALTSNPYSCVTRTAPRYASPARSAAAWAVRSARPVSLDSPATCRPARFWNRCASPLV